MAVISLAQLLNAVSEEYDVYTLEEMADKTYRTLVLEGVLFTRSLDHDKIAQWMCDAQGGCIPVKIMLDITQTFLPILQSEGLIDERGKLSAEAAMIVHDHQQQLHGYGTA